MKVGDLVKPKHKYSVNEAGVGIVLEVEEGFYRMSYKRGKPGDRLTIHWAHGETTQEPCAYVKKLE